MSASHHLTLILGGASSGKSSIAERRVEQHTGPLLYFATGSPLAVDGSVDDDMAQRIAAHVARRDARYQTIEAGADLVSAVLGAPPLPALVDALGTWVAASHDPTTDDFACDVPALCAALDQHPAPLVVVSDEVGLGVHPSSATGRRFRDVLGAVNRQVADIADEVHLVVAARLLRLDRFDDVWPA